jgi:hypothetical protein
MNSEKYCRLNEEHGGVHLVVYACLSFKGMVKNLLVEHFRVEMNNGG